MANKHHEDFWVTVATQSEAMPPNVAHMIGAEKFIERLEPNERLEYVKANAIVWKIEARELTSQDMEDRRMFAGQVKLDSDLTASEITIYALLPQSRAVEFRMRFDG